MNVNSLRVKDEKSQSWLLGVEALAVGIFLGYQASRAGASDAGAFAVGIGGTAGFYALIVLVTAAFWIWTVGLTAFAGYSVHRWLATSGVDEGWVLVWTAMVCLLVVGMHTKARIHSYAQDFGPSLTRVKTRE